MKLSIIIVNYNVKHYLEQCLLSVERSLGTMKAEVWVVDNNSSDGSVEYLRSRFPWVYYIENKVNVGFSKANNQAIRQSRGEYVMLLNPDTVISESTASEVVDFMDKHPEAGGVGLKMLRTDGSFAPESRRGVPTPWTSFCKITGLGTFFPKSPVFGRYYMQYLPLDRAAEIDIMSGACMTLRREALDKIGLLDETFFMYGEDVDISYRILNAGYKNYYIPNTMLHYKGESTQKSSYRYAIVFHKAMYIFFKKHFSYNFLLLAAVSMAIYGMAFITFVKNKLNAGRMRKRASVYGMRNKKFLLVGRGYNLRQMQEIMERHHFYHSVLTELPDKLDSTADYVVFDSDTYSFGEILDWFTFDGPQRQAPLIGTYLSQSHIILTGNTVIK